MKTLLASIGLLAGWAIYWLWQHGQLAGLFLPEIPD
jgi:hypothetical protein